MNEIGWPEEKRDFTSIVRQECFPGTNSAGNMGMGRQISREREGKPVRESEKSIFSGRGKDDARKRRYRADVPVSIFGNEKAKWHDRRTGSKVFSRTGLSA